MSAEEQRDLFAGADDGVPRPAEAGRISDGPTNHRLRVTFETIQGFTQFDWTNAHTNAVVASGRIRCTGLAELTWSLTIGGKQETARSSHHLSSIRAALR